MEIEMKYGIGDKDIAENIWEDPELTAIVDEESREKIYMKAAYFDTDDNILSKHDIAFRVRMEGNRVVASLKWNGEADDGLHAREEINVPVNDEACFINPNPEIFKESESGQAMLELIADKKLHSLLETRFIRSRFRIDTGSSLCEVAIDVGDIVTDFGSLPICELEIELFSGEQEDMIKIGNKLKEKYGLVCENRSKYARGLELLEKNQYID
ncbi:CYTH domain-containing protein [Anaerovorax odorimutans]|uniref:CYTH domain-containing protein n=1 Tax=Anaerovorax odorimutans TaxID=109327 RepID=UPI000410FAD5|nr:CYTH domain-containing protein [Anaerovorax odorimutans]